jgi:hypothetical protein
MLGEKFVQKYLMNTITAIMHKALYATQETPVLAIDGVPLYQWIKSQVFDRDGNDNTDSLVPAQDWLVNDDEARIAWKLLEPVDKSSTVVPLLVCPDDRDLSCTVVAVEQVVDGEAVLWKRFGLSQASINGVVTSVLWSPGEQSATFDRNQFEEAVQQYKRLSPDIWNN